jgi:hypothetical protein
VLKEVQQSMEQLRIIDSGIRVTLKNKPEMRCTALEAVWIDAETDTSLLDKSLVLK